MVLAFCHLTGRNSTVPPKSIPSITSSEPIICPWEALLLQDHNTLPKRNIHLQDHDTLPKWTILSQLIWPYFKEASRMAIHIPSDMIPRMDWNTEDKQTVWVFYRKRLEQYFIIAGTPVRPRWHIFSSMVARRLQKDGLPWRTRWKGTKMMQILSSRPLPIASRNAPVTGRPGMNTSLTSSSQSIKPWLN